MIQDVLAFLSDHFTVMQIKHHHRSLWNTFDLIARKMIKCLISGDLYIFNVLLEINDLLCDLSYFSNVAVR